MGKSNVARKCFFASHKDCTYCGFCHEEFVAPEYSSCTCCRCQHFVVLDGNEKRVPVYNPNNHKMVDAILCAECSELYEKDAFGIRRDAELDTHMTYAKHRQFGEPSSVHIIEDINEHLSAIGYSYMLYKNDEPVNYDDVNYHAQAVRDLLTPDNIFEYLLKPDFISRVQEILMFYSDIIQRA